MDATAEFTPPQPPLVEYANPELGSLAADIQARVRMFRDNPLVVSESVGTDYSHHTAPAKFQPPAGTKTLYKVNGMVVASEWHRTDDPSSKLDTDTWEVFGADEQGNKIRLELVEYSNGERGKSNAPASRIIFATAFGGVTYENSDAELVDKTEPRLGNFRKPQRDAISKVLLGK